ncbi:E protein [Lactate dehydrogenase-elevating virus]|uniref:E protein n=1 Tax=Lactate dehydrogenase-elevating virus TaxID=11048 RepID=UPI00027A7717|nr:E protein [Lactate dehydrogenase-elevating virus]WKR37870.1 E [Lactate dehydrogenase-elevating virus] [Lactate dehydrogenase-elevating virus]
MGNVATLINKAIEDAFIQLIVSILDILVFLGILFGLTIAGWLLVWCIRLVFAAVFRASRKTDQSDIQKVL